MVVTPPFNMEMHSNSSVHVYSEFCSCLEKLFHVENSTFKTCMHRRNTVHALMKMRYIIHEIELFIALTGPHLLQKEVSATLCSAENQLTHFLCHCVR